MVNFGAEGDEYSILPADSDGVGRADSNGTDFCTVIESIGRNKKALAPDIIFRGKELHKDRFSSDVRGNWVFHLSYEGGSYQCLAVDWLNKIFVPNTDAGPNKEPVMLVLDGHSSHDSIVFDDTCKTNSIHLILINPHISHICQPCDQ